MKQIGFVIACLSLFIGFYIYKHGISPGTPAEKKIVVSPSPHPTIAKKQGKQSLFVPYWTIGTGLVAAEEYDELIYFGIAPSETGIDKTDAGFSVLTTFIKTGGKQKKILTIRMTDSRTNSAVLENREWQNRIATEAARIAKDNAFDGVLLDFELASLSFDSVIKKISDFTTTVEKAVKAENLTFGITIYGDTFYRLRPYNVSQLQQSADKVYIMMYDFSKARENPGPNFPLSGKDSYGYDVVTMITDFSNIVPKEKITVVFGMFGYDWPVDKAGKSTQNATSISFNEAQQKFITKCVPANCVVKRDEKSGELRAEYDDINGIHHVVWFEDTESVEKKKEYLLKNGITSFAFWAYSYF